jgi:hypothetical protein
MVEIKVHQMISVAEGTGEVVRSAVVAEPWICVVLESGRVILYEMNLKTKDIEVHAQGRKIKVRLYEV